MTATGGKGGSSEQEGRNAPITANWKLLGSLLVSYKTHVLASRNPCGRNLRCHVVGIVREEYRDRLKGMQILLSRT